MTNISMEPLGNSDFSLLLVEDDDVDVYWIQRLLVRLPHKVNIIRAHHGEEALSILDKYVNVGALTSSFVILTDLNMPCMNGFEFLKVIDQDETLQDVSVFVYSTSDESLDKQKARQYRIDDYLVKPLSKNQLQAVFDSCKETELPSVS